MSSINERMAKGIVWMVAARLMDRSIGIVSTLILARLLVPGDFGLVAMATALAGILDLLGSFSFDLALIQNPNAERRHYDTVWTFNVLFGIFCGVAMIVLAHPAAHFYNEPRLIPVIYVLSFSYFLGGFGNVGVITFRKELNFRQEFIFVFTRRLVTFIVTISAAFWIRSYWALLLGMTVGRCVNFVMGYTMNSYRPKFNLSAAKELFHFSKWLLINNGLLFILHDGCTFVIGRLFGATGLGIYSISYEISNLPSTELVAPINRVTFPGFSKMNNAVDVGHSYLRLLGMITLLILPVGVGIAAVAEPLVLAALGAKWVTAIPLIAILGLSGAISATQTNNGSVWLAMGRPRLVALVIFIYLTALFPLLYVLLKIYGIVGAGYAYLAAQVVNIPVGMIVTKRLLKFHWADVLKAIWRPVVASPCMYFSVLFMDSHIREMNPWARLSIDSLLGIFVYSLVVLILWNGSSRPSGAETFCLKQAKMI